MKKVTKWYELKAKGGAKGVRPAGRERSRYVQQWI
jgi:hypothetical protein